ncbi:LPS translocon maturation chaperone LptM [Paenochrobactrum glaciei]|uniref:Lipoprotein n=1 Tax=Paenochrobactrum glaciei TaxID=486407 RepID=A0ABP3QXV3_9HYPH
MSSRKVIFSALVTLLIAGTLSACGRKGPPELPPAAIVTDEYGRTQPAPKPAKDEPFILDKLIP